MRSCADSDRDSMHETSFRIVPIKELSVVGPGGDTRCTNLAIPLGQRWVIASIDNRRADIAIEVIRIGERLDGVVRIRRAMVEGFALAALIPADIMLPRTSSNGGPHVVHAALMTSDGTVLGERVAGRAGRWCRRCISYRWPNRAG